MSTLHIAAQRRQTRAGIHELYEFLIDFRNFETLLPPDKATNFKSDAGSCSFTVAGLAEFRITIERIIPDKEIVYHSHGPAKTEVHLHVLFYGDPGQPGECEVKMDAKMNPFLKGMAQKPLTAIVETVGQKLSELDPGNV